MGVGGGGENPRMADRTNSSNKSGAGISVEKTDTPKAPNPKQLFTTLIIPPRK